MESNWRLMHHASGGFGGPFRFVSRTLSPIFSTWFFIAWDGDLLYTGSIPPGLVRAVTNWLPQIPITLEQWYSLTELWVRDKPALTWQEMYAQV